jgi:hypothetical protein
MNTVSDCQLYHQLISLINFILFAERLLNGIAQMKQLLAMKCSSSQEKQEEINQRMDQIVAKATGKENILPS